MSGNRPKVSTSPCSRAHSHHPSNFRGAAPTKLLSILFDTLRIGKRQCAPVFPDQHYWPITPILTPLSFFASNQLTRCPNQLFVPERWNFFMTAFTS